MKPEQKAHDLIIAFSPFVTTWDCYHDCPENPDTIKEDAKKCALICVDEIIAAESEGEMIPHGIERIRFWQKVKECINKPS